jgi:hypothetical protein
MTVLGRILRWCYAQSIRLYPADFRNTFVAEMQTVFRKALEDQNFSGLLLLCGRELRTWPGAVLRAHLENRRKLMSIQDQSTKLKPGELLAAITIFLVPPLAAILLALLSAVVGGPQEWLGIVMIVILLGSVIVPLIFGVVRGFPRWSPPYLGILLIILVWFGLFWNIWGWMHPAVIGWFGTMGTWSMPIRILIEGMQAMLIWLLMLFSALILVSLLRLWPHARPLWQHVRQDWTQLSFILYGGLILHIILIFDEYQSDEPWLIAAWTCLGLGAWLYLRTKERRARLLILLCGATLAMWIVAIGKWVLVPQQSWEIWFEHYPAQTERWFESLRTIADWFCLTIALLLPSLLRWLPQDRNLIPEEEPALI